MHELADQHRVEALHHYEILDSLGERTFDLITSMLAEILDVPHACVSLVDTDRVWFKSSVNIVVPEVKRELGFCSTLVISNEEIRYIEDARRNPDTFNNSLVTGPPGIRFYAGAPLCTVEGYRIGTLCAFGPQPRGLEQTERQLLSRLATLVMHEIELRHARKQLKRTEEALHQSQRLDNIGMITSGIAHDFNNLLGGILGHTELLKMEVSGQESAQKILTRIQTTGRRAADLVRQLLVYAGKEEERPAEAIDFNQLIRDTHQMLESSTPPNIRWNLSLSDSLPPVLGQATGLRQLVLNLLTNAADACPEERGEISLETDYIRDKKRVCLTVSDNGRGMVEELQDRVFEPFFSTKKEGRGLGLAICKRIVNQHGGSIHIDSKVGEGTRFWVELSVSENALDLVDTTIAAQQSITEVSGTLGLILIVDDEEDIRNIVQLTLEKYGYRVLTASGGAEAIEMMGRIQGVSTMILDWSMPDVKGEQVLKTMQERRIGWPVVLSSGGPPRSIAQEVAGFKIDGFLSKPYSLDDLVSIIEAVQKKTHSVRCST